MITLPHFPTPSRMTMTAGQTKKLRNPLAKNKKGMMALFWVKTTVIYLINSRRSLINKMAMKFMET